MNAYTFHINSWIENKSKDNGSKPTPTKQHHTDGQLDVNIIQLAKYNVFISLSWYNKIMYNNKY